MSTITTTAKNVLSSDVEVKGDALLFRRNRSV